MSYGVRQMGKGVNMMAQTKEERLNVRIPPELMASVKEAAEKSGWGVSDQVRYELLKIRGMWNPYLPTQPASEVKNS